MTSRQRLAAALERRTPDRVPVIEMGIDWKVMDGLGYLDYFQMFRDLELDAIPVNQYLYLMGWRKFFLKEGRTFRDEWGVKRYITNELLPFPIQHPVQSLQALKNYSPPDPRRSPLLKAVRIVRKRCRDKAVLVTGRAVFAASWYLCGMETLLMSYIQEPDFALHLAKITAHYYKILYPMAVKAGADIIILTDDYAYNTGCMFSPDQFRRFILPGFQEVVAAVKEAGAYCIKHTDGDISQIIDMLVDSGIDGLGPLEPGAGMDLVRLKKTYGDKVAFVGNVDVDLLSRGSVEEVAKVTRQLVEQAAPGGGYILSSGNSITSSVQPENYLAMLGSAKGYDKKSVMPSELPEQGFL